jgi:MAC/Perforin domain
MTTITITDPARQPIAGTHLLGHGINPFSDFRTAVHPICDTQGTDQEWQYDGKTYYHGKSVLPSVDPSGVDTQDAFSSREEYQKVIGAQLSIEAKYGAFSGRFNATYGSSYEAFMEYDAALKTYASTRWKLQLEDKTPTDDAFKKAAAALPSEFKGNEDMYYQFFVQFGAYIVTEVSLGGSMDYASLVEKARVTSTDKLALQVGAEFDACFKGSGTYEQREEMKKSSAYTKRTLKVFGGKTQLLDVNLSDPQDWNQKFTAWKDSIDGAPIVAKLQLTPISSFVADDRKKVVAKALEKYMESAAMIESSWTQSKISVSGDEFLLASNPSAPALRIVFIDRTSLKQTETKFEAPDPGSTPDAFQAYWSRVHDHLAAADPQEKMLLLATERWLRDRGYYPSPRVCEDLLRHGATERNLTRWDVLTEKTLSCPVAGLSYVLAGAYGKNNGTDALVTGFGRPDKSLRPTARVAVVLPREDADGRIKVIRDGAPAEMPESDFYVIKSWSDAPRLVLAADVSGTPRAILQDDDKGKLEQYWFKYAADQRYGWNPSVLINYLTCGVINGRIPRGESEIVHFEMNQQDDVLWDIRGNDGTANFVLLYMKDQNWNLASAAGPRVEVRTWDGGDHAMLWQQMKRMP